MTKEQRQRLRERASQHRVVLSADAPTTNEKLQDEEKSICVEFRVKIGTSIVAGNERLSG